MCRISHVSVLVIVPTHSNSDTLQNALSSIRSQTYQDLDIQIIADGASTDCIKISENFCTQDSRFSLQVHPKSKRRGEEFRDETIKNSNSIYITYLADDDLFLPDHVEYMITQIQGQDFVNPRPTFINRHDRIWCIPADISLQSNRDWHLNPPMKNSISLSGVMHTRDSYNSLPEGWARTPEYVWTDLHMWKKFLINSNFKFRTTQRCTILKFLGSSNVYDLEKVEQNNRWFNAMTNKEWLSYWEIEVARAHQLEAGALFAENYKIKNP